MREYSRVDDLMGSIPGRKNLNKKISEMSEEELAKDFALEVSRRKKTIVAEVMRIYIKETYGSIKIFEDMFPEYFV